MIYGAARVIGLESKGLTHFVHVLKRRVVQFMSDGQVSLHDVLMRRPFWKSHYRQRIERDELTLIH
jgi:hypothetical protein